MTINTYRNGHIIVQCDATTGHAVVPVAFCDTAIRAQSIVRAFSERDKLRDALQRYIDADNAHCNGDQTRRLSAYADACAAIANTTLP